MPNEAEKKYFLAIMVNRKFKEAIAKEAADRKMSMSKFIKTSLLASLLESKSAIELKGLTDLAN